MEKAYDIKELGRRLKAAGLVEVEDAAEAVVKEVVGFLKESAQLSTLPYDDLLLAVYPKIEELLLKQADKIDGEVQA